MSLTNPDKLIKIAPIGTKPHCIAAILFAIKYYKNVEVVYDNPIHTILLMIYSSIQQIDNLTLSVPFYLYKGH